jgi:hypothetical protein
MSVRGLVVLAILLQPEAPSWTLTTGGQSIVLAPPASYVEVSRIFPDGFRLRQETIPKTNRLLAWLIPLSAVKKRVDGNAPDYVTLQVQELTPMAQSRYDATAIASLGRELQESAGQLARLGNKAIEEVLRKPKFEEVGLQIGIERSLGVLEQGTDFVTAGVVVFDKTAGNQVSSSLVLSSFFLVRGKILLLVASGREASAAELTAVAALLGEWRAAMRSANR